MKNQAEKAGDSNSFIGKLKASNWVKFIQQNRIINKIGSINLIIPPILAGSILASFYFFHSFLQQNLLIFLLCISILFLVIIFYLLDAILNINIPKYFYIDIGIAFCWIMSSMFFMLAYFLI